MQRDSKDEVLLAEEQAVISRRGGIVGEVEAAFDAGKEETEGTLLLTDRRLIYVHGAEKEEDIPVGETSPFIESKKRLIYSDVEDLESIPPDPANLSISLDSVRAVLGHHVAMMAPKLEVRWNEGGQERVVEFVQQITGGSRRRNLNDWAKVIERIKRGEQKIAAALPPLPDEDTLEGRIVRVLGDMQEKGLFTIENEVEARYGVDLDPDAVEEACNALVSKGLVKRSSGTGDKPGEDPFYQKVSPLGEDDLNI